MAGNDDSQTSHSQDGLIDSAFEQEGWGSTVVTCSMQPGLPEQIAGYRIIRRLGTGGMGMVLEAEQQEPRRNVALKLLRTDILATEHQLHAFRREVRALAMLQHASIAAIYDAGQTDDGRPYFAMELVRGVPITAYVVGEDLSLKDRLVLFRKVCDAVRHAHQRGIIHRDLKPSNILVDSGGLPKVLDLGLAKMLDTDTDVATIATESGRLQGTLPYMSPEQVRGRNDLVDTRTDVYSLGVVLFELLTGRLPYAASWSDLSGAVYAICTQAPARLDLGQGARRSDLDVVVETALAKDSADRYQSVERLSEDIRRVLAREPILARPPALSYRLRKFVARNMVTCALGAFGVLAVVAGLIVSTALFLRADQQRARAVNEAARADAINRFLIEDMLRSASAAYRPGEDVTVRSVLDTASERVETAFPDHPRLEASIRTVLANVYFTLNDFKKAEQHLRRAHAIFEREVGPADVETMKVLTDLARARHGQGEYADAERIARAALAEQEHILGSKNVVTIHTKNVLGNTLALRWKFAEAERYLKEAHELASETMGERDRLTLDTLNDLAVFYWYQQRFREAIDEFRYVVALRRELDGPRHPATAAAMNNLGLALWSHGELVEAEAVLSSALDVRRTVLPQGHPDVLTTINNLALVQFQLGAMESAERLFREVYEGRKKEFGDLHRLTADALQNVAIAIVLGGDIERARPFQARLIELRRVAAMSTDAAPADHGNYAFVLLTSEPADLRDTRAALDTIRLSGDPTDPENVSLFDARALAQYQSGQMEAAFQSALQALSQAHPSDVFAQSSARVIMAAVRIGRGERNVEQAVAEITGALPPARNPALQAISDRLVGIAVRLFLEERFPLAYAALRDLRRTTSTDREEITLGLNRMLLIHVSELLKTRQSERALTYMDLIHPLLEPMPSTSDWLRAYALVLRGVALTQLGDPDGATRMATAIEVMRTADGTPLRDLRRALELAVAALDADTTRDLQAELAARLAETPEPDH